MENRGKPVEENRPRGKTGGEPGKPGQDTQTPNPQATNSDGSLRGNPTTIQQYNYRTGKWISTTYTYDEAGNVVSTKDPNGNSTGFSYTTATNYSLPSAVTNAKSQSAATQYDLNAYAPTYTHDLNNNATQYKYSDPLDRLTEMDLPNGGTITYAYNSPTDTVTNQTQTSGQAVKTETLYDGLGRTSTQRVYEAGGGTISTTTTYDGLGRVGSVTNPSRPGDGLGYATTTNYDALNRVTSVTNPDGLVRTTSYSGNKTTVTDEAGKTKTYTYDGLGRLTSVAEDPYGLNYPTTYTYDVMNNLISATQSSQSRTFKYDSQQLLFSASNPESGSVTYNYDLNGNPQTRTDARGVVTTYTYDTLNRLLSTSYSDGTPTVSYTYDSTGVTNGIGQLTQVQSSASTTNYSAFDSVGNVTASNQATGGITYNFGYSYDWASNLKTETYPSGRTVTTSYDASNRVSQVTGSTGTNYASNLIYAPHGAYKQIQYGNNLYRTFSYNSRLQPSLMQDAVNNNAGSILLQLGLTWTNTNGTGNNGNLQSVTQNNGGPGYPAFLSLVQTYAYDSVNRLSAIYENPPNSSSGYWDRFFSYDAYGNMWVSGYSGLNPSPLTPQSQSAYNSSNNRLVNAGYDAAGNQTTMGTFSIAYDAENRQKSVYDSTSGNTQTYGYDGNGRRVTKGGTVFVYDAFGNLAAQYNNGSTTAAACTTCYLSVDHLGSTRLVTDSGANVVARHDYGPFGEELSSGVSGRTSQWDGQDGVSQKFTGQERDPETGSDYFQARYMASVQGRFLSVDPGNAGADPTNPQSWNGYAYVMNSPLSSVDPSGTCDVAIYGITMNPGESSSVSSFSANKVAVFPYEGTNIATGLAEVIRGGGDVNAAIQGIRSAIAKTPAGQSVNIFTFSGGAQTLATAWGRMTSAERGKIGNITYSIPGTFTGAFSSNSGALPSGNGTTTMVFPNGSAEIPTGVPQWPYNIAWSPSCSHDVDCILRTQAALLQQMSGSSCQSSQVLPSTSGSKGTATSTIQYGGVVGGGPAGAPTSGYVFTPTYGEEGNFTGGFWYPFGGGAAPPMRPL